MARPILLLAMAILVGIGACLWLARSRDGLDGGASQLASDGDVGALRAGSEPVLAGRSVRMTHAFSDDDKARKGT